MKGTNFPTYGDNASNKYVEMKKKLRRVENSPIESSPCEPSRQPEGEFKFPPGFVSTSLTEELSQHPHLHDSYFLAIPPKLLDLVEPILNSSIRMGEKMEFERHMAQQCHHVEPQCVGYWSGRPLFDPVLRPTLPLQIPIKIAKELNWDLNEAQLNLACRTFNDRIGPIQMHVAGYSGWLVTNLRFLDEHDELLRAWQQEICRYGLSGVGRILTEQISVTASAENLSERYRAFETAVRNFLIRWRLSDLVAPLLPIPMQPMLAGAFPVSILPQLMSTGGVFSLPDTFPLPSRDELRNMLRDALRTDGSAEHLAEWHSIIDVANSAKNRIDRFARIRRLAHFWRLLHLRHADALKRKTMQLQQAFAQYFNLSNEAIKADLKLIAHLLGNGWQARAIPITGNW